MSLVDSTEPAQIQVQKQAKIIEALMRRIGRQPEIDVSAYSAFQSAIELQKKIEAQSRDLARATSELESARYERERSRQNLVEALSSMAEGLAVFFDGKLEICNELFRRLLPDITEQIVPGLPINSYFDRMYDSSQLVSCDGKPRSHGVRDWIGHGGPSAESLVLELTHDRWYQLSIQRSSSLNVLLLLTEITEIVRRNRMERETLIDQQADYLRAVFHNASSGMCTLSPAGEITMQNRLFREILDVPLTEVQEGASLDRLLGYLRRRSKSLDRNVFRSDRWRAELTAVGRLERRVRLSDEKTVHVQATTLPDGGRLIELKDVTLEVRATEMLEQRVRERTTELTEANQRLTEQYETKARVEEELRLAKEQAEAAVSSKTRFLAAASHDLLQPINAAKLLISTLKEAVETPELGTMVDRLDSAFSSAEYLLHSLLDISRLESSDPNAVAPSNVSLSEILNSIDAEQGVVAARKGVRLRTVQSSAIVRSDPVFLLRSVQNLVVNAIEYTKTGGRVVVGCRHRGDKVVLEVWDTGIGINPIDQSRIFEEFARAEDAKPGTGVGLGLSIVERTCRNFGHRVWVSSSPGEGSVFRLEMDLVGRERVPPRSPQLKLPQDDLASNQIVLLIENDADVLAATTTRLERWGASVLGASSTEAALALVADLGMPPDLILADYQLDGDDRGTYAIHQVRRETGIAVPAIVITAERSEDLRSLGAREGFSVLRKPVQLDRLKSTMTWVTENTLGADGASTYESRQ